MNAGRCIAISYPKDDFYRADEKIWFFDEVGYQRRVEARRVIICPWQNFEFALDNDPPPLRARSAPRADHVELESTEEVIYVCMTGEFPDSRLGERFA